MEASLLARTWINNSATYHYMAALASWLGLAFLIIMSLQWWCGLQQEGPYHLIWSSSLLVTICFGRWPRGGQLYSESNTREDNEDPSMACSLACTHTQTQPQSYSCMMEKKLLFIPVTTVCLLRKEMNHRHTVCWILFSLILILSGFFGLTPMVIYCPSGCSQLQLTQLVKRTLFIPWWSRLAVMWCACFEYSECRLSRRFISWLSFFVGIVLDVVSRYHKCVYYSRNFFIFLPFPPQEDFHLFGGRSGGAMFSVCHQYCESWVAWVQLSPRARCSLYVTSALSWYSLSCGSM